MTRPITGTAPAAIPKPSISAGAGPVSGHSLLKAGSSGPEVQQLQKLLASEGFLQPPLTDQFDSRVSDAVKAYQTAKGLKVDGVVGQQTWGAFNGETNPPGSWLLKQPVGGYSGTSSFDANRSGPPMELNPSSDQIRGTAAQRRLVESARNVAMSMGGYQSQGAVCDRCQPRDLAGDGHQRLGQRQPDRQQPAARQVSPGRHVACRRAEDARV